MSAGFTSSFYDRVGTHQFQPPTQMWGYWPQLNEWSRNSIEWNIVRVGGADHMPVFEAYPIFRGEALTDYTAQGTSKKTAIEAASKMMAESGHCVSTPGKYNPWY